jgi:hypothetical protein
MTDWRLRGRLALDERVAVVAGVLAVLLVVGAWLTFGAYVSGDRTATEQQRVGSWETVGSYDHAARVTRENPVFPVGTTLDNRTLYFSRVSPTLTGQFGFAFDSSLDGRIRATATQRVVLRQVADSGEDETVLWEQTRPAGEASATLAPGESVTVPFSFNATALAVRAEAINEQLAAGQGTARTVVTTTVAYEGRVGNRTVEGRENYTATVAFDGGTYRVVTEPNRTERAVTRPVTVERPPGPLAGVGGPVLFAVGFLGLAGLAAARAQGMLAVSETERASARHRQARREFEEWITVASLPDAVRERPRVDVEDLEGLVDLAIDTDERVIESPGGGQYYVVHDGLLYQYEPSAVDRPAGGSAGGDDADRDPPTDSGSGASEGGTGDDSSFGLFDDEDVEGGGDDADGDSGTDAR